MQSLRKRAGGPRTPRGGPHKQVQKRCDAVRIRESPETCCGGQLTRGVSLGDAFLAPSIRMIFDPP